MLKVINNEKIKENIYLASFTFILSMYMLRAAESVQIPNYHNFLLGLRGVAYLLLIFKIFFDTISKKFNLKLIVLYGLIGLFLLLISYQSKTIAYFIYFLYIIGSKDVNYKKVIFIAFIVHAVFLLIIISFSLCGILPDTIQGKGRMRHSLGLGWCTNAPNMFLYITLYYIYIRSKNIKIFELLIFVIINCILFVLTDTKSAFALTMLAILLSFIVSHVKYFGEYKSFYKYVLFIVPVFLPIFIICCSLLMQYNLPILNKLDRILSARLTLGYRGIVEFGIHPLASNIQFIGGEPVDESTYNFVDSSYIKSLLNFGWIFFLLFNAYILYFAKKINENKDVFLMICFIIFLVHSTFDPQLLLIEFNDFFLFGGL